MRSCNKIFKPLEIYQALTERYEAIYILDIDKNLAYIIKSSQDLKSLHDPKEATFEWDETIKKFNERLVKSNCQLVVENFYSRENLKKTFSNKLDKREVAIELCSGKWEKIIIQPYLIKNNITKQVLITVLDFTLPKRQIENVINSAQRSMEKYYRLFIDTVDNLYGPIIKFNLESGSGSSITVQDENIIEVPTKNWDSLYKQLFLDIHPEDKDVITQASSMDKLMELKPGEKLFYTYRSNRENPDVYRWYTTTIKMTSELGDATAYTQDITDNLQERKRLIDKSEHDVLTYLFNKEKLDQMIKLEYINLSSCGIIYFDIKGLDVINKAYSYEHGDKIMKLVASSIYSVTNKDINAYRYGEDEFILIARNISKDDMDILFSLWKMRLDNLLKDSDIKCNVDTGRVWVAAKDGKINIKELINHADKNLYEEKQKKH
ncbi:MAG: GGDEF domain-containing protein [Treponema sp.]|nr:GGDEF domain-containing protein [Treponema sp.]